jgi:lipopolysaccharide/colanic/teichoic acid biosynthesis glycosyltransferase
MMETAKTTLESRPASMERLTSGGTQQPPAEWGWLAPAPGYERAKRWLDIAVALLALLLLSPILLVMAVLIKVTSRGPVFYRGTVIGRYGRPFTYYKLRTMIQGDNSAHKRFIEQYVRGCEDTNHPPIPYKLVDDPRITPVGHWLRRSSLDEMGQMINVLRGEMSIVGPRPPVPYEYEHYGAEQRRRLAVLPGISGLAQVRARSQASFEEMVAIDMEYIQRRSLRLDLAIMARTIGVVLGGRGAH